MIPPAQPTVQHPKLVPAGSQRPAEAILVAHTHWDRDWYLPFEQFRIRLVRLVDRLLDILERDPDFRCFMLDGQMVVVEDYLEVRPERRADLARLVREGRLLIGPWYVLPDEYLVSPESFIRNLELGIRMAEEFGGAMQVGYEPDAFGHIGQLPQILAGFGIDNVVFWRGLGDEVRELGSEFWWLAPDGTRSLAILLPLGYDTASYLGYPSRGDEAVMPFHMDWALSKLERNIGRLSNYANTPCVLLMAGVDHEEANPHLPEIVREARRRLRPGTGVPADVDLRMGSLPEYIDCVREFAGDLPEYCGELRFSATAYALQQVYSARIHLKQRNNFCQTTLERYAEPYTAFANVVGLDRGSQAFLDLAWRELLKNHPHDDICGCSVDAVHRQMDARFDRIEQVGEALVRDALRFLTDRITVPDGTDILVFVFNPNTQPIRGTALARLGFPPSQGGFAIRDEAGNLVPHQELGRRTQLDMEVNRPRQTLFVDVALSLPDIPACGYHTLSVDTRRGVTRGTRRCGSGFAGGVPDTPVSTTDLRVYDNTIENQHLRLTFRPQGTIEVLDWDTGITFEDLHAVEDTEDAGDEYTYSPARQGKWLTNADARVELELLSEGPVRAGYRIRYRLPLPLELAPDRSRRSDETVDYLITTDVWLGAGDRSIDFVTRVTNTARDHRLRVIFPTPLTTDVVHVDGHFDVVERPVALPEGRDWHEPPSPTAHQRTFVDVSDGQTGLAIFNRGLPEYEARQGEGGVEVALTLLRCVGWLSRGDMLTRPGHAGPMLETPGAQCPGDYEFHYAIQPHAGAWEAIIHDAHAFNAPCAVLTDRTTEGILPTDVESPPIPWERIPRGQELDILPSSGSFVTLSPPELVLSSVRQTARGSLTVRCYNPTTRTVTGRLQLLWPVRSAVLVNFLGAPQRELQVEDGAIVFDAPAKGIITIHSELAQASD